METPRLDLRWPDETRVAVSMAYEDQKDPLAELEHNQAALRRNIEASEELIARSDELLGRLRAEQAQGQADQA